MPVESFRGDNLVIDGSSDGEGWFVMKREDRFQQPDGSPHPLLEEGPQQINPEAAEAGFVNHQQ